jgi:hypothetical protein
MAVRRYPGRPNPFAEQKAPRSKGGLGMGIGAVVFLIVLFGILLVVLYLIPPLMEDAVFPDIGIPYPTLFMIILGVIILVSIILMFRPGMYAGNRIGYRDRDPTTCQRVIKDGYDGPEVIISGPRESTFAEVCRANWLFKNVAQNSSWFIRDSQGNDVGNASLESVDDIFILAPEYRTEVQKEEPDKSEEISSIHDGVTYYD